jgi:uncharacterized Zn-finger protein
MATDIDNEGGGKICAACRREIDRAAIICPYCRSNADYQTFVDIPSSYVTRKRRPIRSFILYTLAFLFAAPCVPLFGFWPGAVVAMFALVGGVSFAKSYLGTRGFDELSSLPCPKCGHQSSYEWPRGALDPGKNGDFVCSSCGMRVRARIVPSNAADLGRREKTESALRVVHEEYEDGQRWVHSEKPKKENEKL